MDRVTLSISNDADASAAAAAAFFVGSARQDLSRKGSCSVALSGGSTPMRLYRHLAGVHHRHLDWERLLIFWSDERWVGISDPESNAGMALKNLITPLGLCRERIHPVPTDLDSPERAAAAYEKILIEQLGEGPRFDLILLGVGCDGHTASLYPGTGALDETCAQVAANWVVSASTWRITFTYPLLNRARRVMFLATGSSKAEPVRRILEAGDMSLPAARVHPERGLITWFLDAESASRLQGAAGS